VKNEKLCRERQKLFELAHDMLDAGEASNIRAHAAECAACRDILDGYRRLDAVLEEWKPLEPSAWFDARVRAAAAAARPARPGWLNWGRWLAPALATLVIVAGVAIVRTSRSARRPRPAGGPGASLPAPASGKAAVNLAAAAGQQAQAKTADQELKMYENLPELENYDLLSSFDVLSELPKGTAGEGGGGDIVE
jgi:hypothetical protein